MSIKAKITAESLRIQLFAALERINDDQLSGEELKDEIQRAKAVGDIAGVIIDLAKAETMHQIVSLKHGAVQNHHPSQFFLTE